MNYTSKEASIRLKELGFECEHNAVIAINPNGKAFLSTIESEILVLMSATKQCYPAYTSDQLFIWLRENYLEPDVKFFEIQEDGIYLASFTMSEQYWVDYKTNLTDMLAHACIWILEQKQSDD